uniref:Secreted protein n=1 Tax=Mycena chlorophos TaxID=658473 RepID=A0ABQ0L9F3_MYCCL|nr:predicted protein [Mycena chlorophos]
MCLRIAERFVCLFGSVFEEGSEEARDDCGIREKAGKTSNLTSRRRAASGIFCPCCWLCMEKVMGLAYALTPNVSALPLSTFGSTTLLSKFSSGSMPPSANSTAFQER